MSRLAAGWRPVLPPQLADAAADCVVRAQAALLDEHVEGALRQMLELYDLLVPPLDAAMQARLQAAMAATEQRDGQAAPISAAAGLCGLWDELPDVDVEHESIEELLVWHAGGVDPAEASAQPAGRSEVAAALAALPRPRSHWWRRLSRRAAGGLGDCGHITVQRGSLTVLERPPPAAKRALAAVSSRRTYRWSSELGSFFDGDRLTLRWPMAQPGQLAVVHALEEGPDAELSLLLPKDPSEAEARRQHEIVELTGELDLVDDHLEHAMVVLWGPELLPPSWASALVARRQLPPEVRVWLYRYTVKPCSDAP